MHTGLQDESLQVTISIIVGCFNLHKGDFLDTGDIPLTSRPEGAL